MTFTVSMLKTSSPHINKDYAGFVILKKKNKDFREKTKMLKIQFNPLALRGAYMTHLLN